MSKFINRVGEKHTTNQGMMFEIVECFSSLNCTIKFNDGLILYGIIYRIILSGSIRHPFYPSTFKVGFEGVGEFTFKRYPKIVQAWRSMLTRCYSVTYRETYPSYFGCSVAEEWHNFQNFAKWFEENYNSEYMKGWHLDKDILVKGNKVYSPETCCFVPQAINILFTKDMYREGKYAGVIYKESNRFQVIFRKKTLGTYGSQEEARDVYILARKNRLREVAEEYKDILDMRIYNIMINTSK